MILIWLTGGDSMEGDYEFHTWLKSKDLPLSRLEVRQKFANLTEGEVDAVWDGICSLYDEFKQAEETTI